MASSRWEEVADDYGRIFRFDAYYYGILGMVADEVAAGGYRSVLDLGCGTGNLTALVRERCPGAKVCGVDPAERMVELATDRFRDDPGVEIRRGEGTKIPYESESFDCVVSNLALHHVLPELRPLCAGELSRVLEPGGRLVYSDLFWRAAGPKENPARLKEIIESVTAYALHSLEAGAHEMAIFLCEQLPLHLREKNEYVTVLADWLVPLEEAGFASLEVTVPPHPEFGFRVIRAEKAGS